MKPELLRKTAHCFRTDEKTVEKFIHDFFAAHDINKALEVQDAFIEAHIANMTHEEVDDFIIYIGSRGENNGT